MVVYDGNGLTRYTLKSLMAAWALFISDKGYTINMVPLQFISAY